MGVLLLVWWFVLVVGMWFYCDLVVSVPRVVTPGVCVFCVLGFGRFGFLGIDAIVWGLRIWVGLRLLAWFELLWFWWFVLFVGGGILLVAGCLILWICFAWFVGVYGWLLNGWVLRGLWWICLACLRLWL